MTSDPTAAPGTLHDRAGQGIGCYLAYVMSDDQPRQALDYAAPDSAPPSAGAVVLSVICLIVGVLLCAVIGLPALIISSLQGRPEFAALMFVLVGGALCAAGMRLKRRRRGPAR